MPVNQTAYAATLNISFSSDSKYGCKLSDGKWEAVYDGFPLA